MKTREHESGKRERERESRCETDLLQATAVQLSEMYISATCTVASILTITLIPIP